MTHTVPELLSPAGSPDSLRAALAGGADAVYFGGSSFSNRMCAKNFTDDGLTDAIKLCHDCGAKAYITINTRVRDREIDDVLRLCGVIAGGNEKCDAVIMADLGLARAVKREFPNLPLHASTQTSLMSPADCEMLSRLGFTRLVVPRELSMDEIVAIAGTGFETEMFIHGAHCVSCSGQCLMSFIMGGRSGNRGECAQPCRLPYKLTDGTKHSSYPLSLADMCLAPRITDVIDSGVTSLKIEGRLKSAPYVFGVTKIYRTLLDERRNASADEIRSLASLFSRGFTDGYFTKKYFTMADKNPMSSDKSADKSASSHDDLSKEISRSIGIRVSETRNKRLSGEGSTSLCAEFLLEADHPSKFTLTYGDIRVSVSGDIPQIATGHPIDSDSAAKNLTKLGGTGFTLAKDDIKFTLGSGLWLPASSLNDLRRRAADSLACEIEKSKKNAEKAEENRENIPHRSGERGVRIAMICEGDVLNGSESEIRALLSRFNRVYVPRKFTEKVSSLCAESFGDDAYDSAKIGLILPLYTTSDEAVDETLARAKKCGIRRVLCHTIGQVKLVNDSGMIPDASFRTNVTNSYAADYYRSIGCASVMLSPEAACGAYKSLGGGAIVYGRIPLMALSRCVICEGKCRRGNIGGRISYPSCAKEHECATHIVDRIGERFPVRGQDDCVNVVYNSTVNWMGDRIGQIDGAEQYWFVFTDEDTAQASDVMDRFEGRRSFDDNVRRI